MKELFALQWSKGVEGGGIEILHIDYHRSNMLHKSIIGGIADGCNIIVLFGGEVRIAFP